MTTSFAMTADDFTGYTTQKQTALRGSFDRTTKPVATKGGKTSKGDTMMGGIVMDTLFSAFLPGLGSVFNGMSALDTVELYDTFRDATAPTARERALREQQHLTPRRRPTSAVRQLLALVFG